MSSLAKKYVMALTGFILVGFVLGHMAGNLQMFLHPDWINEYAYKLQHLPYGLLWVVRLVLLATVVLHVVTAVMLLLDNKKARPQGYSIKRDMQATIASKTMRYTGMVLLAFIVFHIAHFTTKNAHPEFKELHTVLVGIDDGHGYQESQTIWGIYDKLSSHGAAPEAAALDVHDVYSMVALGFSPDRWYSLAAAIFYLVAMALLFLHLSHGISSMFQSLGLRNAIWRARLDRIALILAIVLFLGFGSIPLAGLLELYPYQDMVQSWDQLQAVEAAATEVLPH